MSSPADLLGSLARLTSLLPGGSVSDREGEADAEAPPSLKPLEPTAALIAPLSVAGDSLAGLSPPSPLDPTGAAAGLIGADDSRASLASLLAGSPQPARGGAQARASATRARPASATALTAGAKPGVQALRPADAKQLSVALATRLYATPAVFASLALGAQADASASPVERAGVIASLILNASTIPGWPLPTALQPGPSPEAVAAYAAFLEMDEAESLACLVALGGDEVLSARLTSRCDDGARRGKLLRAALILAAAVGALVTALRIEIEELLHDFALMASSEAPESQAGRVRLPLK